MDSIAINESNEGILDMYCTEKGLPELRIALSILFAWLSCLFTLHFILLLSVPNCEALLGYLSGKWFDSLQGHSCRRESHRFSHRLVLLSTLCRPVSSLLVSARLSDSK